MSTPGDNETVWKELLINDIEKVVAYFYPDIHADIDWTKEPESLEQEFRNGAPDIISGKRLVDKLIKLIQRDTKEPRYLHFEIQAFWEEDFGYRVHAYNLVAMVRYGPAVVSLPLLIDSNPKWLPTHNETVLYATVRSLTFRSKKLLSFNERVAELEADGSPMALYVLAWLKGCELAGDYEATLHEKVRLIRLLKDAQLDDAGLNRWLGYFDWLLWCPAEYNDRVEELLNPNAREDTMTTTVPGGFREYLIEKYSKKGHRLGLTEGIGLVLDVRFGAEGIALLPQIEKIEDLAVLQTISKEIKSASLSDIQKLIPVPG